MRVEILTRLKKGERASKLAREFGVSRQAVSLLKIKRSDTKSSPRLVEKEEEKLRGVATTTRPSDHGLAAPDSWLDEWSAKSLHKLAETVAKRRLMVLPIRRLFHEWFDGSGGAPVGSYDPDRPESLATIPTELRDSEFLQFLRERKTTATKKSPQTELTQTNQGKPPATKRARRGTAASLMPPPDAWEFLNPEMMGTLPESKQARPIAGPPSQSTMRTGKHRGSKGSPFTAARKKKKKR
ncbi:MAG: hypothetical protein ACKO2G_15600 [Verrucomicrobiales bacterium]